MPDTCNSRSLNWLVNSCIPKSSADISIQTQTQTRTRTIPQPDPPTAPDPPISSLPDDLLLTCLARAPLSSLPSAAASCRRFSLLLSSPSFYPLRRSLSPAPLVPTLFSLLPASSDLDLIAAVHPFQGSDPAAWRLSCLPLPFPLPIPSSSVSLNNLVFLISRGSAVRIDTWTARISPVSRPSVPRKKFAAASLSGKIYVAGGSSKTSSAEIYDPDSDTWTLAPAECPVRRYGCVGASAGEVFYVAGGIRVGADVAADHRAAHAAAGTVDAYHARAGVWVRGTRAVPGGGCVVGACGVGPSLYVVATNAVEFTLWRWDQQQEKAGRRGGGEWVQLEGPPVRGMMRVGAVRFSCCPVGEGRMAAAVHVGGGARGGQNGDFGEGMLLVYDVGTGIWSRGPDLPAGFRRAGLVCVEC